MSTQRKPSELTLHPVAELFPEMTAAEFRELSDDIELHDQLEPIWIDAQDRVIDGRHRLKVAAAKGRTVDVRVYEGDEDSIQDFVISLNLKRRHLSESQRAMIAARLAKMKPGRPEKTPPIGGVSQCTVAQQLNVSPRSVQRAAAVQKHGTPELQKAVDAGTLPVSTAAKAAAVLTPAQQIEVLKTTPGKIGDIVRKEVAKHEAKQKEIEEVNAWVEETNTKMRSKDFDPIKERARMKTEGALYSAIESVTELPAPAEALAAVSPWCEYRLAKLDDALAWMTEFTKLYKESRRDEAV